MCDWDETEYAEYLLWVEAARTQVRAGARQSVRTQKITPVLLDPQPSLAAEA